MALIRTGGSSEVKTTLWTNSAPTSNFTGQNVTLSDDMSNYKTIRINYSLGTSEPDKVSYYDIPSSAILDALSATGTDSYLVGGIVSEHYEVAASAARLGGRAIYASANNALRIDTNYRFNLAGDYDAWAIPLSIEGIN